MRYQAALRPDSLNLIALGAVYRHTPGPRSGARKEVQQMHR